MKKEISKGVPLSSELKQGLIIRHYDPGKDSISEITRLINHSFAYLERSGLHCPSAIQDDLQTLLRIRAGSCLVACTDHKLLGTITYYAPGQLKAGYWFNKSNVASFGQFAISPNHQNMGIGRLLLEQAEKKARKSEAKHLALSTPAKAKRLVTYYQKKGYKAVEIMQWPGVNYLSCILNKPLYSK